MVGVTVVVSDGIDSEVVGEILPSSNDCVGSTKTVAVGSIGKSSVGVGLIVNLTAIPTVGMDFFTTVIVGRIETT